MPRRDPAVSREPTRATNIGRGPIDTTICKDNIKESSWNFVGHLESPMSLQIEYDRKVLHKALSGTQLACVFR